MISRDLVGGLAAVVIGAVYLYFAYQLRVSALDDSLGPSGMPRIYGWLLLSLGLILTAQAVLSRLIGPPPAAGREALRGEWEGQGRRIAWAAGLLAIGAAYLFVVEKLGYLVSVALLILAAATFLGARFGTRLLAIAALGAVALWAIFALVLGVSMPSGLLGRLGV
ncbi:tripartite tricarboxylate transporter TctB family protein [Chelativorans salis]|uniref:Tripartite tricarboxylate transporter TctB family protein n=1 Tax=Chelativorans salis TaxID=2978478 RepID=A0ABT2LRN9_9HYPH|nr:tripartite tricarboxylate transporter TctB family protein [Chelativorans sp. EGI FJ00035]MCT7376754.1 tripartite tricarboxylate transporter TctB family protein [Chelativorans sp. EGI FJ00035]